MGWLSRKNDTHDVAMVPVVEVIRVMREYADSYPDLRGAQALHELADVFAAAEDPIGDEWAEYPPPE